jgi:hypothetical protein
MGMDREDTVDDEQLEDNDDRDMGMDREAGAYMATRQLVWSLVGALYIG